MESQLLKWAFTQGPVVVVLVIILAVGYKAFVAHSNKQSKEIQKAWDAKSKSDDDRFSDMKDRFNSADRRHEECEERNRDLENKLFQLACMSGNQDVIKTKPFKSEPTKSNPAA